MIIGGEDRFYNGIALRGVAQPLALYELLQALLDTRIHKGKPSQIGARWRIGNFNIGIFFAWS